MQSLDLKNISPDQLEQLTGCRQASFLHLVDVLHHARAKQRGRPTRYNCWIQVTLTLMKLRLSLSLRALQAFTGIHAVTISRYVNRVCHILGQLPLAACTQQSTLLVDTTCCRVATTAHQTYSGHKHQRCAKVQVLADESGQILDVSAAHPGSMHDKTVWNQEFSRLHHLLCDHVVLGDKAYAGAAGEHQYLLRPIKRGETLWQQDQAGCQSFNADLSKRRVRIEHLFARIKTWKVLNGIFPYRWQRLGEIVRVIAVIHNLERGA